MIQFILGSDLLSSMNTKEIQSMNEAIWEQKSWGYDKVAKLLEDQLEEDLK